MNDHITPGLLLVSTYGTQVLIQYQAMLDPAGAAALAAPVAALGVAAAAAALRAGRRTWRDPDAPSALPAAGPSRGEAVAGGAIVAAVLAMALAVPVGALVRQAGSWAMLAQAFDSARPQAWQTLRVAGATAAVCAALAPLLAGRWLAAWRRGRASLVPLVLVNLAVPPSLIGIGLVRMTTWPGLAPLADSAAPLVAAQVARFLPVVTLLYLARERRRSVEPLAAARAHGLGALATLVHVWWPSHRATVAAAGLLGGVLAATELETSVLLAPPGGATLGVRLYALIHTVPQALTAALALDILLAAAPAIALLGVLAARGQREETA
jgi:iron(III) transport system permease protein